MKTKKIKKQPSTIAMEKWSKLRCEACGGHGGGHFRGCRLYKMRKMSAIREA